MSELKRYS